MESDDLPAARRRLQPSILLAFSEIAETYLTAMRGKRMTWETFASLQKYLDEAVTIQGTPFARRGILLAVHDMKKNMEAPATLQRTTKAQLIALKMQPLPEIKHCSDVATAILRMEAVLRQSVSQAPQAQAQEPLLSLIIAQQPYYRQRLHASMTTALANSMALSASLRAYVARQCRQVPSLTAALMSNIRFFALRGPAAHQNIGLPST
jgi:hypothetical protein